MAQDNESTNKIEPGKDSEGTMIDSGKSMISQSGAARRYELKKTLGKGAMGIVHLAKDSVLERDVAIKELHQNLTHDRDLMDRFRQEAKVLAKMAHPGVVQIYDFIEDADVIWIVMEFVKGQELLDYIKEKGRLSVGETLSLGALMAEALGYAHSLGIIHRDFKPANVLLTDRGMPKIMDFGLARLVQSAHHTMAGTILGSPAYMSPEQAQGKKADERSDIYALGIVLYRMLTGKVPFEGEDLSSVLTQHISVPPAPPKSLNPDIPDYLNALVLTMLEKDPARRLQDMETVARALRNPGSVVVSSAPAAGATAPSSAGATVIIHEAPATASTVLRQTGEIKDLESLLQEKEQIEKLFKEKFTKHLTVMFTDLKGSTSIAEKEGDLSSRMLIHDHNNIVFPAIKEHKGVLVKTMGDGTLSYFENAQDALRAGAVIQKGFEKYNIDKAHKVPILVRVGLHTGSVIMENNDIFGDTVNTASRFESSANPGEIYMSEETYDALANKEEIICKFEKTTTLKGKAEPVKVYKAFWNPTELEKQIPTTLPDESKKSKALLAIVVAVIVAVIIVVAFVLPAINKGKGGEESTRSLKHDATVPGERK